MHPKDAIAVKELYQDSVVTGWAVLYKGKNTGDPASQWFNYQTNDRSDPTRFDVADWDAATCTPCHQAGGVDMIISGYPLAGAVQSADPPALSKMFANGIAAIPTDTTDLFTWLKKKTYSQWYSNTSIHQSVGPHGNVKSYYNPTLEASYKNGKAEFPIGVAAVKEVYDSNNALAGWVVLEKTKMTQNERDGWFFYWKDSIKDPTQYKVADWGVAACADCHEKGHNMMMMSGYPLK